MATVIRTNVHPDGWIDFYMGEELILCEETISVVTAQQLWDSCQDAEDDQLAQGFLGIADAEGKNPFTQSPLAVNLLRSWRLDKEGVGALTVRDGNVTNENTGVEIFETNPNIAVANFLATAERVSEQAIAEAVASQLIEGGFDLADTLRLILAATTGKASGAATTEMRFRDVADTKDRIVATVDEYGNRPSVTLDPS